ncbi:MAG: DUF2442 domain-containing protein [Anaerolineae bacterium]
MSIAAELEMIKLKLAQAEISDVRVTDDELVVALMDGRTVSAPLLWFPRLFYGNPQERSNFVFARDTIHWPDLDEDIGLPTLLLGRGQGESPQSLQRWLEQRKAARNGALPVDAVQG